MIGYNNIKYSMYSLNYIYIHLFYFDKSPWPIVLPKGGGGSLSCSRGNLADMILSLGAFLLRFVFVDKNPAFSSVLPLIIDYLFISPCIASFISPPLIFFFDVVLLSTGLLV
jgi:hypothetical protein